MAPGDPEENQAIHHPRQEAGQDASIAERLERNPESKEGLDPGNVGVEGFVSRGKMMRCG